MWNETIGKCCHFQNIMLNVIEVRVRCMSEAPNSGLLLIDSEETYNFAVDTEYVHTVYHTLLWY